MMFLNLNIRFDGSPRSHMIEGMKAMGIEPPGILYLFNFKPAFTQPLAEFTAAVMRGPSALTSGMRELIAAYTSNLNRCLF